MCGRFTLAVDPAELEPGFEGVLFPSRFAPRYNIAPSQPVLAIPNDGQAVADFFIWGLIPSWAKDPSIGNRLINARGESLAEKPAFRAAYKQRRCLILADGFYEWKAMPGSKTKVPHYIQLAEGGVFAFAGLWSEWRSPDGSAIRSCTIVTTMPNELLAGIHNRMPLILLPEDRGLWLDPAARTDEDLKPLVKPFPSRLMRAYPVSTLVNNPAVDRPECVLPA